MKGRFAKIGSFFKLLGYVDRRQLEKSETSKTGKRQIITCVRSVSRQEGTVKN